MSQQINRYFACPEDGSLPNVYDLFQYYDIYFFNGQLSNCEIKWSKRMTYCAGQCIKTNQGSLIISLSQPLLQFRSSNQLKQTLLHQMIHAYLFKTNIQQCKYNGGHGQAFLFKMIQINQITHLNITVFHNFNREVQYYQQHVWRCNGICRNGPPFYGYVRRAHNRPPQPADYWWNKHLSSCGGEFIKISQPKKSKQKDKKTKKQQQQFQKTSKQKKQLKKWGYTKTIQDYIKQINEKQTNNKYQPQKQQLQNQHYNKIIQDHLIQINKNYQYNKEQQHRSQKQLKTWGQGKTIQDHAKEIDQYSKNQYQHPHSQKQLKTWGHGKTIQDYVKQENQTSNNKQEQYFSQKNKNHKNKPSNFINIQQYQYKLQMFKNNTKSTPKNTNPNYCYDVIP